MGKIDKIENEMDNTNKKHKQIMDEWDQLHNPYKPHKLHNLNNFIMVIDVETTGFPEKINFYKYYDYKDIKKYDNSRIVQIAWSLCDTDGKIHKLANYIIKPNGFTINNSEYHKITNEIASDGMEIKVIFDELYTDLVKSLMIVGHNLMFSENIILSEAYRCGSDSSNSLITEFNKKKKCCTGYGSEQLVGIKLDHDKYKMPSLEELYHWCFKEPLDIVHNAKHDVINIGKCYFYIHKNFMKK